MGELSAILSVLLCIFGIILLIVLIILGIRLLFVVEKADKLLDEVESKVNSFDGLFNMAEKMNSSFSMITEVLVTTITNAITKLISKKGKKEEDIIDE